MSIDYEVIDGRIARIHLNRPETHNSIGPDDARAILSYLKQSAADDAIRVVIFSGEGTNFSSGADLKDYDGLFGDIRSGKRSISAVREIYMTLLETVRVLRDPNLLSIAAPQGWAAGQGLELCIASDFIVASDDVHFYFAESQVGAIMTSGMGKLLPQMVGLANARRLMLFGEKLPIAEADRMGLVTKVVPKGQQVDIALEMAEQLAAGAPLALAHQKRILDAGGAMDLAAVQDLEMNTSVWIGLSDDAVEAGRAFAEKRPPVFRGT